MKPEEALAMVREHFAAADRMGMTPQPLTIVPTDVLRGLLGLGDAPDRLADARRIVDLALYDDHEARRQLRSLLEDR